MEPSETTAERQIGMLLSGWSSSNSADKKATILVYSRAVRAFSVESIQEAVDRFLEGRVQGHNPAFAPSCAEFAREVRQREELYEMAKALAERPQLPKPEEPVFTEEHRDRMRGLIGEWGEAFAAGPKALTKFMRKHKIKPLAQ